MQGSCGSFPEWGDLHRCSKWRHVFWPGAATWCLNWSFLPPPPICLFILDAFIVQERGLVCYPHFQHSWNTEGHNQWLAPTPVQSILYQLIQRHKILQTGNFSWNSAFVGLLHPSSAEPEHKQVKTGPERQRFLAAPWEEQDCLIV